MSTYTNNDTVRETDEFKIVKTGDKTARVDSKRLCDWRSDSVQDCRRNVAHRFRSSELWDIDRKTADTADFPKYHEARVDGQMPNFFADLDDHLKVLSQGLGPGHWNISKNLRRNTESTKTSDDQLAMTRMSTSFLGEYVSADAKEADEGTSDHAPHSDVAAPGVSVDQATKP